MRKLILFFLLSVAGYGQTANGTETKQNAFRSLNPQTVVSPVFVTTMGADGTMGKASVNNLPLSIPTKDYVDANIPAVYTTIVYVNATSPTTATIFDDENPPTVNDDALKINVANLYIGTDGSTWVYKTSPAGYVTKIVPASSNFNLYNTSIDAGNNKESIIERFGAIASKSGNIVRKNGSDSVLGGGYFSFYNNAITSGNTFQLNASNGLDLWNFASGAWNKRFTFSSAGDINATGSGTFSSFIKAGSIEISNGGGGLNNNFAIGQFSLEINSTGVNNIGVGFLSLNQNSSGQGNIAIGRSSLETNSTGNFNTAIGLSTGGGITTGSGNTIIGANVSGLSSSLENNIIIANGTGAIKAQHNGTDWNFTGGISSPSLTGTPTAPTAAPGTNTTQIATTAFVQSTTNSNAVLLTGNQTKTGVLTFANTASTQMNGITLTNSGGVNSQSLIIGNSGAGSGLYTENTSTGVGNYVLNQGGGKGIYVLNTIGSGNGITSSSFGGATGKLFVGSLDGTGDVFTVDKDGVTTSTQYRISALNTAPSSATDTGTLGEIRITATYIYVCTATNTWVRTALATW